MSEKIVVFGAGATERGHAGLLAWEAGYQIVLVDKNRELVDALSRAGEYTVRLYGIAPREITVTLKSYADAHGLDALSTALSQRYGL